MELLRTLKKVSLDEIPKFFDESKIVTISSGLLEDWV